MQFHDSICCLKEIDIKSSLLIRYITINTSGLSLTLTHIVNYHRDHYEKNFQQIFKNFPQSFLNVKLERQTESHIEKFNNQHSFLIQLRINGWGNSLN